MGAMGSDWRTEGFTELDLGIEPGRVRTCWEATDHTSRMSACSLELNQWKGHNCVAKLWEVEVGGEGGSEHISGMWDTLRAFQELQTDSEGAYEHAEPLMTKIRWGEEQI